MAVVRDAEVLLLGQAKEGFVPLDLVLVVQLHRSFGHDVAVVLDGPHVVVQSIDFLQVNFHDQVFWVLLGGRLQWVLLSVGPLLAFLSQGFLLLWIFDHLVDFLVLAGEGEVCKLVVFVVMLIVERRELLEFHAAQRAAPVEPLLWKFVPVIVGDAEGDVVVSVLAGYLAPEQQLLEIIWS